MPLAWEKTGHGSGDVGGIATIRSTTNPSIPPHIDAPGPILVSAGMSPTVSCAPDVTLDLATGATVDWM